MAAVGRNSAVPAVIIGVVVGFATHLIALWGVLVSVGIFGASVLEVGGDPTSFVIAGISGVLWGAIVRWTFTPGRVRKLAVLSFILTWALVGLATYEFNRWWWLSLAAQLMSALKGASRVRQ